MISILDLVFMQNTLVIVILGGLINVVEPYLPSFIKQTFRYGKFAHKGKQNVYVHKLEVPKSWFKHFYAFAAIYALIAVYLITHVYILRFPVPEMVQKFLSFFCGPDRTIATTNIQTFAAILLIDIQCFRRFYETHFIQVFSSKGRINVLHYIVGHLHYFGVITATLGRAQGFVSTTGSESIQSLSLTTQECFCMSLFVYFWYGQYKSNVILANLRKDKRGKTVTEIHKIPQGGLFKYVSSPHMLCEVGMYVALYGILHNNGIWLWILLWVASNQIESAYLTHKWYKKTFKDYPKNRKAIIPFIL